MSRGSGVVFRLLVWCVRWCFWVVWCGVFVVKLVMCIGVVRWCNVIGWCGDDRGVGCHEKRGASRRLYDLPFWTLRRPLFARKKRFVYFCFLFSVL